MNSQLADRQGEYYRKELSVSTTSAAAYTDVTVSGTGLNSSAGKVFTPKDPVDLTYDASGNLTQDGRWDYIWDGENRLVKMVTRSSVAGISGFPFRRLEFVYDTQGRRIEKRVYNVASGGSEITHKKYLYDGWNLLMEVDAMSSANNVAYTWGLDLSGTDQGAGGVGGLLMIHDSSTHFVAMDGNGNVAALTDGTDVTGQYEYDPFGNLLRVTGSVGVENPFRFSTKYWDEETGLVYYGFRYYSPVLGRWVNRDPIEESGGYNLFANSENDLQNYIDFLGFWKIYNALNGRNNTRFELSMSALIRKFNLPRIPGLHKSLESYGIVMESKQLKKEGQNCVEISLSGFGNAGFIKNAIRDIASYIPIVGKKVGKVDADLMLLGAIKALDCECFDQGDLVYGGELKIQASAGYGINFGSRPRARDYRSGAGKSDGLKGIRGLYAGTFAEFAFAPIISSEGLDLEASGSASVFGGYRGDSIDLRLGGDVTIKGVVSIVPEFKGKEFSVAYTNF